MASNHKDYEKRLRLIKSVILDVFDSQVSKIKPLAYDPECPFPYNNFIYHVRFSEATKTTKKAGQPGTHALPTATTDIVLRLTNTDSATGLNQTNRVENEVASLHLTRQALEQKSLNASIVPKVYAWSSNGSHSWIAMEHMQGCPPDSVFSTLDFDAKSGVLKQIAQILAALQNFELPASIDRYGGMRFDDAEMGKIVSGEMTLLYGRPFESYSQLWKAKLQHGLDNALSKPIIDGWKAENLFVRIVRFIDRGLEPLIQEMEWEKKCLVHGDFTMNNMLINPETLQLTAILDFDWSFIGHAADEYLQGFGLFVAFPDPFTEDAFTTDLLTGFDQGSPLVEEPNDPCLNAKLLDEELSDAGAERYSTLARIKNLASLYWLEEQLCPFPLREEIVTSVKDQETLDEEKAEVADSIRRFLEMHGF